MRQTIGPTECCLTVDTDGTPQWAATINRALALLIVGWLTKIHLFEGRCGVPSLNVWRTNQIQ